MSLVQEFNDYRSRMNEKRILLVDDVITTGATLVSTATVLNAFQPKEISFGAIAIARH